MTVVEAFAEAPEEIRTDVAYVIASKYRQAVIEALEGGPRTPTSISEWTGRNGERVNVAHVSRSLGHLRDRETPIVELLVPEDTKKGRIYHLTEYGTEVADHARRIGGNGAWEAYR